MNIAEEDKGYFLASMRAGEVVLILGAGASATSVNKSGETVKVGLALAAKIAERVGLKYEGEKLSDVLNAARGILSGKQLQDILTREYVGVKPSRELDHLFSYTWKRLYTWNIDDSLFNLSGRSAQRRRFYNGLIDKAAEPDDANQLHLVYLHGEATKPEHGFILTELEYSSWLKSDKHFWYQRAAQDYFAFCPVFIGATLEEPILSAELARAGRELNSNSGRAFLIVPESLSPIRRAGLKARGIIHLQGTLEDFSTWLGKNLPGGRSPKDVLATNNSFSDQVLDSLTRDDIQTAHFLKPVSPAQLRQRITRMPPSEKGGQGRQFLRGFPPSWLIAASDIPVRLEAAAALIERFKRSIENNERLFIVTGQAGSGKTTAVMMALLQYVEEHKDVELFDLSSDVRSIKRAFSLLRKISSKKVIIYVGDLFLFGDGFREDIDGFAGRDITVVSTARSSEWRDRLSRQFPELDPFSFQRFVKKDFDPLIDRLIKYVPAPRFRRLSRAEQRKKLASSDSQLLIALREATESANFSDIITNEFEKLPDNDTRLLLLIVGIATIARVGMSKEAAYEAYSNVSEVRPFDEAVIALSGIVSAAENRRLYARHELYVRHILENVISFSELSLVIRSILKTYLKYEIPVVRSVTRLESTLFRFLLNHDFIYEHARRHNELDLGRNIYSEFEVEFQLDGHYWLQYGLYLAEVGDLDSAIDMLRRSIQAYPDNPYVFHALASVQLQLARERPNYDTVTKSLIDEAVRALKLRDAKSGIEIDEYPIVTLANGHIGALVKHGDLKAAKAYGAEYFDRLQQLDRQLNSPAIQHTKDKVFRFVTLGQWNEKHQTSVPDASRRRIKKSQRA